jgi:uncharacterized membrane protein (UPF0127 family)
MKDGFVTPLLRRPTAAHVIRNERNGIVLADRVLPAFDSKTRRAGLLQFESLPIGHAMVIAPTSAVHTWFMRFPIDLAFVNRRGQVVKTYGSLKPWRMAAALRAFAVIELPAGSLVRCDTVSGDTLVVVTQDPFI